MTRLVPCLGCGMLCAPGPRCSGCRRAWQSRYDANRSQHHALYATSAWKRLSAEVRASATRCTWCLKPTRRLVADHVIPLDERPDLALEGSNLVAACNACNVRRGRNAKLPETEGGHIPSRGTTPAGRPLARRVDLLPVFPRPTR